MTQPFGRRVLGSDWKTIPTVKGGLGGGSVVTRSDNAIEMYSRGGAPSLGFKVHDTVLRLQISRLSMRVPGGLLTDMMGIQEGCFGG